MLSRFPCIGLEDFHKHSVKLHPRRNTTANVSPRSSFSLNHLHQQNRPHLLSEQITITLLTGLFSWDFDDSLLGTWNLK